MSALVAPGQPPILLLTVEVGGEVRRFAERPVIVGTGDTAVAFTAALAVDFLDEIELTATGPPARQVALQLGGDASWSELRRQLEHTRARLYAWAGGELDDAELLVTGRLDEPALSDPELPPGVAAFSLVEREGDDRGLLLESALVDATTYPTTTPTSFIGDSVPSAYGGAYYPEVIGQPGYPFPTWFTAEGTAPGSVALVAQHGAAPFYDDKTLVVAKRGGSRVTSARLWDQDGGTSSGDLLQVTDLRGQQVTVFDTSTLTTVEPTTAADVSTGWAVGWSAPPTTGPGGALRGLGDVLIWALERAGVDLPDAGRGRAWDIDWARTLTYRASLNRFKIDTYIADQVGVWEWLSRDILPFFPVFVGRSGRGIYIAEWRYQARPSEAVLEIEHGRNAQRISAIASSSKADAYTEITARYGLEVRSGLHVREATFTGAGVDAGEATARHPILEALYSVTGRRATSVDVPVVWDLGSGFELTEYLCARYAGPLTEGWYRLPWQCFGVMPGQVVSVVDAEPKIDQLATVTGRRLGPGCVDVRVLLHP